MPGDLEHRDVWGILGGVGPLASAAFVSSIYELSDATCEQELPIVVLLSDPTIRDRTEALLGGRERELADDVAWRAHRLLDAGATRLILCCVSLHPIVSLLPSDIREKLVSLVDVIFESVAQDSKRHLLLCTNGARRTRVFQHHPCWNTLHARIVLPDAADQETIHALIYQVKKNASPTRQLAVIGRLRERYGVESCIAGCTEMHILARQAESQESKHPSASWLDPLAVLAGTINGRTPVRL
jgi:aspartate racemase